LRVLYCNKLNCWINTGICDLHSYQDNCDNEQHYRDIRNFIIAQPYCMDESSVLLIVTLAPPDKASPQVIIRDDDDTKSN